LLRFDFNHTSILFFFWYAQHLLFTTGVECLLELLFVVLNVNHCWHNCNVFCSQQASSGGPGAPGGCGHGPSLGEQIHVKVPNNKVWSLVFLQFDACSLDAAL
jgi:hypothetical protein